VTGAPGKVDLSWAASSDASGIAYYHVYRSTTSGFTPASDSEIGQTTQLTYSDHGDGSSSGLAAGTYYYEVVAQDRAGNLSFPSTEVTRTVAADPTLPRATVTAPSANAVVSGTISLSADASDPAPIKQVSYGFNAGGFRHTRTFEGVTSRYLLGGLFETNSVGVITLSDIDGVAGDLAHYAGPPTATSVASYLYYNGHGDLAASAESTGTGTSDQTYDPFGAPVETQPEDSQVEGFTGRWDKKLDTTSALIEMGVRPYDSRLGRFLAVDSVEGGSLNDYDYAGQDPINAYDLEGRVFWVPLAVLGFRAAPYLLRLGAAGGAAAHCVRNACRSVGTILGNAFNRGTNALTQSLRSLTIRLRIGGRPARHGAHVDAENAASCISAIRDLGPVSRHGSEADRAGALAEFGKECGSLYVRVGRPPDRRR
jgi:RHS repeat-associated protein